MLFKGRLKMNNLMNRKFRLISVVMVFFVATLLLPVGALLQSEPTNQRLYSYAEDISDEISSDEMVEALVDDPLFEEDDYDIDVLSNTVDLLQDVGIDILDYDVSEDNNIVLQSEISGSDGSIEIIEATDESVEIYAEEGALSGTLELKDDGTVWLDGKEVNVIDEYYDEPDNNVTANAKHIYKVTSSCPYGSAADYTTKTGTYTRSAEFEKKATAIPRSILLLTVGVILGALVAATGGTAAGIIAGCIPSVVDLIVSNAGSSKWISARIVKYVHKTKGISITSHRKVWKEVTSFNTGINMTGKTVKTTTNFVDFQWS
jgi:hypothetical protein